MDLEEQATLLFIALSSPQVTISTVLSPNLRIMKQLLELKDYHNQDALRLTLRQHVEQSLQTLMHLELPVEVHRS